MNDKLTPVALKEGQIVILHNLSGGPVKWSKLRVAYFGEGRAKSPATTAFYMQVQTLIGKGLVRKTDAGYELTDLGQVSIDNVADAVRIAAKSDAQRKFEGSEEGRAYQAAKDLAAADKVTA